MLLLPLLAASEEVPLQRILNDSAASNEERVAAILATLEGTAPSETVALLAVPDYYTVVYSSAPMLYNESMYNPDTGLDRFYREMVLVNRVFRKAFVQLQALPKPEAADIINHELRDALHAFDIQYLAFESIREAYRQGSHDSPGGVQPPVRLAEPPLPMGSHAGESTLPGERMRIYALILLAANLGLEGCQDAIQEVIDHAIAQRNEYIESVADVPLIERPLIRAPHERTWLYNREVFATYAVSLLAGECLGSANTITTSVGQVALERGTLLNYDAERIERAFPNRSKHQLDTSKGAFNFALAVGFAVSPPPDTSDRPFEPQADTPSAQPQAQHEARYETGFSDSRLDTLLREAGFSVLSR